MRPLFAYYGGKQRLAKRIAAILDTIPHKIYAEPFCGGSAVLYAKTVPNVAPSHYQEAINDVNGLVTNLYRVAREQPEELHRRLSLTLYSRQEYDHAVAICNDPTSYSDIDKAWAFFTNTQQAFSKAAGNGWGMSRIGENSGYGWVNRVGRLPDAMERLKAVYVDCDDAIEFIRRWDHPTALFYCDPPYPGTAQKAYGGYTLDDYQALCDCLDSIQGAYVLSNYAQLVEPKTHTDKLEIDALCTASVGSNTLKRTEVLWIKRRA